MLFDIVFENCENMKSEFNIPASEIVSLVKTALLTEKDQKENSFFMIGCSRDLITYSYLYDLKEWIAEESEEKVFSDLEQLLIGISTSVAYK